MLKKQLIHVMFLLKVKKMINKKIQLHLFRLCLMVQMDELISMQLLPPIHRQTKKKSNETQIENVEYKSIKVLYVKYLTVLPSPISSAKIPPLKSCNTCGLSLRNIPL